MILRLPIRHKKLLSKKLQYSEVDVEILLKLGALEGLCDSLGLEFWQLTDYMKENEVDYASGLLYQGYLLACKDRFERPKYTVIDAVIWAEYMSTSEREKFTKMQIELIGKLSKTFGTAEDKKKE